MATNAQSKSIEIPFFKKGWQDRTKLKLAVTAGVGTVLSVLITAQKRRPIWKYFPIVPINACIAVTTISAFQESLRSIRGTHDTYNSIIAGSLAGGLLLSVCFGRRYAPLGILVWGTLAGLGHVLNDRLQPRILIEDYLIEQDLLDPRVVPGRLRKKPAASNASPGSDGPTSLENIPFWVLTTDAERIKRAEIERLREKMEEEASRGSLAGKSSPLRLPAAPSMYEQPKLAKLPDNMATPILPPLPPEFKEPGVVAQGEATNLSEEQLKQFEKYIESKLSTTGSSWWWPFGGSQYQAVIKKEAEKQQQQEQQQRQSQKQ